MTKKVSAQKIVKTAQVSEPVKIALPTFTFLGHSAQIDVSGAILNAIKTGYTFRRPLKYRVGVKVNEKIAYLHPDDCVTLFVNVSHIRRDKSAEEQAHKVKAGTVAEHYKVIDACFALQEQLRLTIEAKNKQGEYAPVIVTPPNRSRVSPYNPLA